VCLSGHVSSVLFSGERVVAAGQRCSLRINGHLIWQSTATFSGPNVETFDFSLEGLRPLPGRQHVRMLCYVHGTDELYEPNAVLTFTIIDGAARDTGESGASREAIALGRAASVAGGPVFALSEDCAHLEKSSVTSQGYTPIRSSTVPVCKACAVEGKYTGTRAVHQRHGSQVWPLSLQRALQRSGRRFLLATRAKLRLGRGCTRSAHDSSRR
jgi:hypothetical protein